MCRIFEKPGAGNTELCLRDAVKRCEELGVSEIVVATTTGATALRASEIFGGRVIAVTHAHGFRKPFTSELDPSILAMLREKGVAVVTATHALSAGERAISKEWSGRYPLEVVAEALRMLGEGTKVCVEIVLMAADAGELGGEKVISVAGTSRGADTAAVITPAHSRNLFDLKVNEILCKPSLYSD